MSRVVELAVGQRDPPAHAIEGKQMTETLGKLCNNAQESNISIHSMRLLDDH